MAAKIFVLSGPGGAGKTTLVTKLFCRRSVGDRFIKAVTCTTRKQREGERDGKDYFFVDKKTFLERRGKGYFLETQKVLENYYGTPRAFYLKAGQQKKHLFLCIDVKGGMYLKKHFKRGTIVTIFVAAPTASDLRQRLIKRVEAQEFIRRRVALAKEEMGYAKYYDYVIVNRDIRESVNALAAIIEAEQYRR